MSILTIVFPAQAADTAMAASVETLAIATLGFGLVGIVATLLTVSRAKRARSKNTVALAGA